MSTGNKQEENEPPSPEQKKTLALIRAFIVFFAILATLFFIYTLFAVIKPMLDDPEEGTLTVPTGSSQAVIVTPDYSTYVDSDSLKE